MRVLVTGAAGQDGRILTSALLAEGFSVFATGRGARPIWLDSNVIWNVLDVTVASDVSDAIRATMPDTVFHLAGSSSVAQSWANPQHSIFANSIGTTNVLESVRLHSPKATVLVAGSSEVFGRGEFVADELTPLSPSSPYGVSKAMNLELAKLYRDVYGINVISLIMFNHESQFRPIDFVTRSIAVQAAQVKLGLKSSIELRNLNSAKDWGWAKDFVQAMILLSKGGQSGDFVIATGLQTSVRKLAEYALQGLELNTELVRQVDFGQARLNDESHPLGNAGRLRALTGWRPATTPQEFMAEMALIEFKAAKQ